MEDTSKSKSNSTNKHEAIIEAIARLEGKMDNCALELKENKNNINQLQNNIKELVNKLWIGNGSPSIVSRLEKTEQQLEIRRKHIQWLSGVVGSVVASLALAVVMAVIKAVGH